jgi:FolB domain-containing protein
MDKIQIKDLLLRCIIGTNDFERKDKQDILINVMLFLDFHEAADKDDISMTVNYREITKRIIQMVEGSRFYLLETLAEKVAQTCFENPKVAKVQVAVEKPGALRFARSVGVEILREK